MNILHVSKVLIQIGLIVFFVIFFGGPSLQLFLKKQVLTVTSKKFGSKVAPPAITVVAYSTSKGGWNQEVQSTGIEALIAVCGTSTEMEACVRSNSRGQEGIIFVDLGKKLQLPLVGNDLWREDFTASWYGRSYTLIYPEPIGTDGLVDSFFLHVNTSDGLSRRIFIHDPDYFILSVNPLSLPVNMQTLHNGLR